MSRKALVEGSPWYWGGERSRVDFYEDGTCIVDEGGARYDAHCQWRGAEVHMVLVCWREDMFAEPQPVDPETVGDLWCRVLVKEDDSAKKLRAHVAIDLGSSAEAAEALGWQTRVYTSAAL